MAMTIVENPTITVTGGVDTHLEFHVAAAVDAATAIQTGMRARTVDQPADQRIAFRIGGIDRELNDLPYRDQTSLPDDGCFRRTVIDHL